MSIDIRQPYGKWNWPVANLTPSIVSGTFDYILNINMIHISPWECTEGELNTKSVEKKFNSNAYNNCFIIHQYFYIL